MTTRNNKMTKINLTITVLLLAILISCGQSQREQFTVGVITAQTGILATPNEDVRQGMQLAIEDLKPDIQFIFEDSKSNPKDGVTAAQQLINAHSVDVLISLNSAVSVPVAKL